MTEQASRAASRRSSIVATSLIGSATVIGVILGLIRMKAAAVLVGPAGVGLIGLFQSIVGTAGMLAAAGLGHAAARQLAVAASREDQKFLAVVRAAVKWATLVLAVTGAILVWLLRRPLAELILDDAGSADTVGWLGIAVALTVVTASQAAVLSGLRRVGYVAKRNIAAALLTAVLAVASIAILGERGILLFVLSAPIATALAGWWYVRKLQWQPVRVSGAEMAMEWRTMARLGAAFMIAELLANGCQLFVRAQIQHDLGMAAVGQFQAAWTLSMQYGGLVLAGLSVEYYPRLTAAIERKEDPNRVVNDQVELQLLLGGPAFLLIIGTAPWLMPFLFSSEFSQAAGVLRWQVLADVLWLSIWPVAFLLMALGRAELLMFAQGAGYLVTASMTALLIPVFGVVAAAVASLLGYSLFVIVLLWAARSLTRFGLNRRNSASIAVLFLLCALVAGLGLYSTVAALAVAAVGSAVLAAYAYRRLSALLDLPARSAPLTLVRTLFKR